MSALPIDLIKTHILNPYILKNNPETESLLAARAACIAFWKAMPISEMLGIQEETAQWLLMGETAPWRKNEAIQARITSKNKIRVSDASGGTWLSDNSKRLNAYVCDDHGTRAYVTVYVPHDKKLPLIEIVIIRDLHGVTRMQDTAFFITAIVTLPGVIFLISSLGTVYRFEPATMYDDPTMRQPAKRLNFLRHIPHRKQFDIPYSIPGLQHRFRLRDARTANQDMFLFLTEHGYLLSGCMSQADGYLAIIARNVSSFKLIEGAAICQMNDGSLDILNVQDPRDVKRARLAKHVDDFLVVPELKTLFLASNNALKTRKSTTNIAF
jgi:hypothetical protein